MLGDLADVCDEIARAVASRPKAAFLADLDAVRAMERRLEILGEIATRLGDDAPDADIDWRDLRALRVLLAHAYHQVLPERLWAYAVQDVPRLRAALDRV